MYINKEFLIANGFKYRELDNNSKTCNSAEFEKFRSTYIIRIYFFDVVPNDYDEDDDMRKPTWTVDISNLDDRHRTFSIRGEENIPIDDVNAALSLCHISCKLE